MTKQNENENTTHFGFQQVKQEEKQNLVNNVFSKVASKYDLMNDVMSLGLHRIWKKQAIFMADIHPENQILDLASGSGDLVALMLKQLNDKGRIIVSDINNEMLNEARINLVNQGCLNQKISFQVIDACNIDLPDNSIDLVTISFGFRNFADQNKALNNIYRILKPKGKLLILEFSKPQSMVMKKLYQPYLFKIIPKMGKLIASDEESYQYLAESIEMHPSQEQLKSMMEQNNFTKIKVKNILDGVVAIHQAYKPIN